MKLLSFGKITDNPIDQYQSVSAYFRKVLRTDKPISIAFIHTEANGIVGYHQATVPQLYILVDGTGWVTGEDRVKVPIKAGEGVYWKKGEWHESGTDVGMTALVIESEGLEDYYGKGGLDE